MAQAAAKEATPEVKVVSHHRSSLTQKVPVTGFGWETFGVLKQVVAYIRGGPTQRINCIINYHRRTGRGGEGGCSPPKFWATQIFWAARENLGKASF